MGKSYTSNPRGKRPPFQFELDGVKFVCQGSAQLLDLMDFTKFAQLDITDPAGAAAVTQMFEDVMGTEVYGQFKRHCRAEDTDPEVTMQILQDMVEHTLNRPLGGLSPSATGQPASAGSSTPGSPTAPRLLTAEDIAAWQQGRPSLLTELAVGKATMGGPDLPVQIPTALRGSGTP